MKMTKETLESASFKELVNEKIRLRKRGFKGGIRYVNIEFVMRRRFGRV